MHRSYNIPLNDSTPMDFSSSPQSTYMPNFLIGNNYNQNDSFFATQSKMPQNSMQSFTKKSPTSNLKNNESYHDRSRKHGPPIITLRNASPKSPFLKSFNLDEESTNNSNSFVKQNYLPYNKSFNMKGLNASLKDSDVYSRFLASETRNNNDCEYDNWVTVFGYSSNEARFVLSYFSEIGTIKEHKISNTGNWMHLHYESKMHAVAALNRNGRIINMNMMIGVKPCDDKVVDVPIGSITANRLRENVNMSNVDNLESFHGTDANGMEKPSFSQLNGSIRYLRTEVLKPEEEPEQKPGLLKRAMSMVFGRS